MRLFAAAFLIALNVMWFGLCQMEQGDSVTQDPVCEHAERAEDRRDGWDTGLKPLQRVITESYSNVSGGGSYHPTLEGVK